MKSLMIAVSTALLLASMAVRAENTQQEKMKDCNAQAKSQSLHGDAHKTFMKTCLSDHAQAADKKLNSQQEKMKQCNADAKTKALKGADRKAFLKTCLSG